MVRKIQVREHDRETSRGRSTVQRHERSFNEIVDDTYNEFVRDANDKIDRINNDILENMTDEFMSTRAIRMNLKKSGNDMRTKTLRGFLSDMVELGVVENKKEERRDGGYELMWRKIADRI